MNYFNRKMKFEWKDFLYKALVFISTVAVIVYFLPRDNKFNYQFDINKPWKYGQLIATFDFPIYKSDKVLQQEMDSMKAHFQPYYEYDPNQAAKAIKQFNTDCQTKFKHIILAPNYIQYIEDKLEEVYSAGIIDSDNLEQLLSDSIQAVQFTSNNIAISHAVSTLYSVKEAYTHILKADSTHFNQAILQQCNLNEYLTPNLRLESERTEKAKEELLQEHSIAVGLVLSGQKIIDRGEIVSQQTYDILESLRKETNNRAITSVQNHFSLFGQILYVSIFVIAFFTYLELFRKEYYDRKETLALLLTMTIIYCVSTALLVSHNFFTVYIIPYAMLPMILRVFLDSRTAFFTHTLIILVCAICLKYPFEFIVLQIIVGITGIFSLRELTRRSQLFRSAILIFFTYVIVNLAIELMEENDLSKLNINLYIYFIINGILLLFTYPLLFLVEKIFKFTSNVTLVELSDINNKLLRQMSETVPGTFQHSLQVANLSAEAANSIGADSQLVRTGALYHDIGKMENPVFFTENQMAGINPHATLSYEQSAQIVISHVVKGLDMAAKAGLPTVITDFIRTHHGQGKAKFFYISWENEHPGQIPDNSKFTYPGPNPITREQAILMMADAVEAASRSLKSYDEESISQVVEKIIDGQVADGFFKECPITFKDIATVKSVFKEKLKTIYHTRISYPELKK